MKYQTILTALLLSATISAQELTFEPLFKIGIYQGKTQYIKPNEDVQARLAFFGEPNETMEHTIDKTFDYYTTIGGRVKYKKFALESKNKISIATNDFIDNIPYNVEFYLRAYYSKNKIEVGVEHLCIHPICGNDIGTTYQVYGGHNEVFFSYNFN